MCESVTAEIKGPLLAVRIHVERVLISLARTGQHSEVLMLTTSYHQKLICKRQKRCLHRLVARLLPLAKVKTELEYLLPFRRYLTGKTAQNADISLFLFLLLFFFPTNSLITYLLLQEWSDPGNFDIISKLGIGRREFLILAGKNSLIPHGGNKFTIINIGDVAITYLLREFPVKNRERWDRSQQTGKLSG